MHKLSISYRAFGWYADDVKLSEQALALQKARLGPDDPDTIWGMHNVANGYEALNRPADALKLREEAMVLQRAKLGADHPHTLLTMSNLINNYRALDRPVDALNLSEETLARQQATLGADHPHTLFTLSYRAASFADLGRYADALKHYENALAGMVDKFGAEHPETICCMHNVAWLLANLPDAKVRDADRAVALAERAVALAPAEGAYQKTLGAAYYRAGNWKQSIKALQKSMEHRRGGDSFDWLFLAMSHWRLGEKDEARKWFDRAVQWMENHHPKNEEIRRFRQEAEELLGIKKN
jgi:tetratricopeptide (TPR) repeat protein